MAVRGTVLVTDHDWYSHLANKSHWDEVNFWKPSARSGFSVPEYSPLMFKLKSPHNAIVGFGYFARFAVLPDWLAWNCFGQANGCPSLEHLQRSVRTIRRRTSSPDEVVLHIGCIVIVDVTLFEPGDWVDQPADWSPRTQQRASYDLDRGEGLRIWTECLFRASTPDRVRDMDGLYGAPSLVRPRLGQGAFRVAVTDAYRGACAATDEHSLPALEAAHIRPVSREGGNLVNNGLLLRADVHRLFDQGYLTVTGDHVVKVSGRLRDDYQNGRTYYPLHGRRIAVPASAREHPDPLLLRWHNDHVFLG